MNEKKKGLTGVLSDIAQFAESVGASVGAVATAVGHTVGLVSGGQTQPRASPVLSASSSSSGSPPPSTSAVSAGGSAFGWKLALGLAGILLVLVVFAGGLVRRRR